MVENAVKTICPKNLLPPPFGLIHRTHLKVEVWQQRPEKQRQCTFIGCTNVLPLYTQTHMGKFDFYKNKIADLLPAGFSSITFSSFLTVQWDVEYTAVRVLPYLSGRVYDVTESSGGRGSNPSTGWLVTSFVCQNTCTKKTQTQRHEFREAIRIILSVKSFRMKYIAPFPSTFLSFYLQPPPKNNPRLATCFQ